MTDSDRISRLEDAVTRLEASIGDFTKRADMSNPPAELPNGDYPVAFRQRQLGEAVDNVVQLVAGFRTELEQLKSAPPANTAPASDVAAAVLGVLAQYNVHVKPNKLGVGMVPLDDSAAALHIGGAAIAGIVGVSNVSRTDGQNPDYRHENMWVIADNDGGMRGVQYGRWFNGQVIRNTPNRRMSIFALFDSMGDTCINDDQGGRGQDIYIVRNPETKTVTIASYRTDWKIEVRESVSVYGDVLEQKL